MTAVVVFLQNAWSPLYAGGEWPRASWQRALARSRSGQRLRLLIDDLEACENTTPIVGSTPCSVVPADHAHVIRTLARREPTIVVACGKQAETALSRLWGGPLLVVPHPANRVLTDALYLHGRAMLAQRFDRRVALRQLRTGIEAEPLPPLVRA